MREVDEMMLQKNSAIPLYMQLAKIVRDDIVSGVYKEGDLIPSEARMAQKYKITRTTIRRAIADLVNEGLLSQVHGKGTYVCFKEVTYNVWNFGGFTDYIASRAETPYSIVLRKDIITVDNQKYLALDRVRGVQQGAKLIFLTIDYSQIPLALFPGLEQYDFSDSSLYHLMRTQYHIFPKRAELSMNAILGDTVMKETFTIKKDIPLLLASGQIYDRENREIERLRVVYGPNMQFKVVANMEV
ncbi:GntR family transcriptional regulator [Sporomusa termitida]|uniref:Phosphonate metabolism transcriptional regulator PhnF n=1 Tax=Sporomusa termitida TaxID=2377 RepID=A0A517DUX6_9FIRM|nr:GntR family transcriptional regulator [Sporomusa termitida]QDR81159.1 phosphonate metabolism transcriptional regulator PhnF [Sporomusa termitida]